MRRQPEKAVQNHVVAFLRHLGAQVYVLGHPSPRDGRTFRGTGQTPGIPDLYAVGPHWALWMEVKAPGGRLRPAQAEFQARCRQAGVPHVVGGVDEVIGWALANRLIRETQLAHYRIRRTEL